MIIRKLCVGIFACSVCMLASSGLGQVQIRETIKNKNPTTTGNDLTLSFTEPLQAGSTVTATDTLSNSNTVVASGNSATFPQNSLPSEVAPGGQLTILFNAPSGTSINLSKSVFTDSGVEIVGSVGLLGAAPGLFNVNGAQFAQLTNPDSFELVYTNIALYVDNNLANLATNQFDTPTGQLVSGIPSSLILDPGQSVLLAFGPTSPIAYDLAVADAAAVSNPGDAYYAASAAETTPEPSTLALASLGLLMMIASVARHRRTA
jgi:hypothetical protein